VVKNGQEKERVVWFKDLTIEDVPLVVEKMLLLVRCTEN
jgi:hypothetical protein